MKPYLLHSIIIGILLSITACQQKNKPLNTTNEKNNSNEILVVGVFDKNGDSPYCITDAIEALKIDPIMKPVIISAADIMSGKTDNVNVFLFPGGGGRSETGSLGELGQQKVIDYVKNKGKGVVGICAGAYILTKTPNYPSLGLSGAEAIDLEHDHRGNGLVKFSLTEEGKTIFPELKDREVSYSQYYEGPVLIPEKDSDYKYTELATMLSDVHLIDGTPANMTNNRPFIIITDVGKGKSASVVGHPENTPGMRWMIPRLVRVVAEKELISYEDNVVRPDIYTKEILFTPELRSKQSNAYESLIGNEEDKIQGIQDIMSLRCWSSKKWIPPMVRDKSFKVRLLAAKMTVDLERTDAIPDLEAAVINETNPEQKALLQEQLDLLKAISKSNH